MKKDEKKKKIMKQEYKIGNKTQKLIVTKLKKEKLGQHSKNIKSNCYKQTKIDGEKLKKIKL